MNPVEDRPVEEAQQLRREFFCRHYDACLDKTILNGWPSFSCSRCRSFRVQDRSGAEWFDDSLACASLIAVVFGLGMMPPMPAAEASL